MRRRGVQRFFALLGAYIVVAVPFKAMNLIPGFTDIRPVQALGPVYGVFFGIPLSILMQEEFGFVPARRDIPGARTNSPPGASNGLLP